MYCLQKSVSPPKTPRGKHPVKMSCQHLELIHCVPGSKFKTVSNPQVLASTASTDMDNKRKGTSVQFLALTTSILVSFKGRDGIWSELEAGLVFDSSSGSLRNGNIK
uniref:Uncharacterized protein n=1 Tax=Solanum lycopersicum TaxID=4081 RepID=A0A3Q7FT98_SOLLC